MLRPPTRSPRTNPLLPYTSLFRSRVDGAVPGLGQCRALQRKRAPYGDGRTARGFVRGRGERDRRRRCQLVSPGRGGGALPAPVHVCERGVPGGTAGVRERQSVV